MTTPKFEFKPLVEQDLPTLFEWQNRVHVAEWWDGAESFDAMREEYLGHIDSDLVHPALAVLDGAPVGYIQSYVVMGHEDGWWPDERDPGARGMDQFLANAGDLGKGLGTEIVRQFAAALFEDRAVSKIQVDPDPDNLRAIRCYEKAGFRRHGVVETPDGEALLMLLKRS